MIAKWSHPAFAGNRIYASDDKTLVCVELPVAGRAPAAPYTSLSKLTGVKSREKLLGVCPYADYS